MKDETSLLATRSVVEANGMECLEQKALVLVTVFVVVQAEQVTNRWSKKAVTTIPT
jgi:hypothetical protein